MLPFRHVASVAARRFLLFALAFSGMATIAFSGKPHPGFRPGHEPADWPTTDGVGGTHYSPLSDITPATVSHLEVAWTYRTGDFSAHADGRAGTAFEATPIMVEGVLFVATPYSRAIALDAESGRELWSFDPGLDRSDRHHGNTTSRGLSYWKDPRRDPGETCAARILLPVFDARLFALDARTGLPCPDFARGGGLDLGQGIARLEGRRHQYKLTAPPTVVGDLVVVGSSIFDGHYADAPSGAVRAFDIRDLLWQARLPASAQSTPMTYRARPGGRQFVVVAAGGHAGMQSSLGDHIVAFALPVEGGR